MQDNGRLNATARTEISPKGRVTREVITNFLSSCTQSTVKLLAAAGGNVDLQTGSFRGNVTALMLAAAKGHLDVVKTLVELKASPDKKGEIEMVIV